MAGNSRSLEQVRKEVEAERAELTGAVDSLRTGIGETNAKLRARLPILAAGALGVGFVVAGGARATVRLLGRRGREGRTKARSRRFPFGDRD
jgi:hypothetical protein